MPVEVILPKVDMDMATGKISRWFFKEGASVKKGDVLFEIETNKATMEIDAPASGVLRDVTGKEGVDIPVGEAVAWIYEPGEDADSARAPHANAASAPPQELNTEALVESHSETSSHDKRAQDESTEPAVPETVDTVRATPLARRRSREAGIDLSAVVGSGPKGRVVKADVEAAIDDDIARVADKAITAPGVTPAASAPAVMSMSDDAVLKLFDEGSYELVPHDTMRRTIARRLVEAKLTIPHFYLNVDCNIDALLALRAQFNAAAPIVKTEKGEAPAYKLSVNDLVIKAMAMALMGVPDANVSWNESAMVRHKHADVCVAVAIPGGLITPIIRKAEQKTLSTIANEMKDLATRARNRKLKPEEYQGGTTAVSNLGKFGIKDFAAVINPPHATILAVGAGEERAIVRNGAVVAANMMSVTLSTDHRAVDGALGAELLVAFKRYIENPMNMVA